MVTTTQCSAFKTKVFLAFTAIYFIWGSTYLAARLGLQGLGPFTISTLRYGGAAVLLTLWSFIAGISWPRSQWNVIIISGLLMLVGGSGLVVYAEQYISSGMAAVLIAMEPLLFVVLDREHWPKYKTNRKILAGLLLGFSGIVLYALGGSATGSQIGSSKEYLLGILAVVAGAFFWVAGTLYAKRKLEDANTKLTATTIQLFAATILSLFLAVLGGEQSLMNFSGVSSTAWLGLVYLTVMGTLISYLAFTWLIKVQPPALVSTHTLVNPVIAVLLGWMILNENVSSLQWFGLSVALLGVGLTWSGKNLSAG